MTDNENLDTNKTNNHSGFVLWLTGLSGSGKTSLANAINKKLSATHAKIIVLDGDEVRSGLCSDLDFSKNDRQENIRRIGEVTKLLVNSGFIVIAAFVSPYKEDREKIRQTLAPKQFHEVYCNCALSVCESRDSKGLYERARRGEIKNFTGISDPYEPPENPDLTINSAEQTIDEEVKIIVDFLNTQNLISI